jgi:prepilin-type N-terminal cleavage/methylation domain-containing protein
MHYKYSRRSRSDDDSRPAPSPDSGAPARVPRTGFTFVEILVVTAVIATLAALFVPRISESITRARIGSSAARITALLNSARRMSITGREICRVTCLRNETRCDIFCDDPRIKDKSAGGPVAVSVGSCAWSAGGPVRPAASETAGGSEATITFQPDGTADGPSLSLSDDNGNRTIIEIFSATGLPYVYEAGIKK